MPVPSSRVTGNRPGKRFVSGSYRAYTNSGGSGLYPPLSMYANIYGPGVATDSKANLPVDDRDVSIRFVASATSTITSIVIPWRWGPGGYSTGSGDSYTISIRDDNGGIPSASTLATVGYTPSGAEKALNDTRLKTHTFSSPPSVTQGNIYHIVFHNDHGSPTTNYSSVNMSLRALGSSWGGTSPLGTRQPAYSDVFAILYGGTWTLRDETPVVNIAYASGAHDGNTYLAPGCNVGPQSFGGATYVRQRFRPVGTSRNVTGVYVRPKLLSGSGALTVDLRTTGGSSIESFTIPAASFLTLAAGCNDNGEPWLGQAFSQTRSLSTSTTYEVRLTCAAGTTYRVENPLREDDSGGTGNLMNVGARWSDRIANVEVSTDSGSIWNIIYGGFPVDLAFYFTLG